MQVKLLLFTFYLNCGLHQFLSEKPSERMSNFWMVRFSKSASKLNFGFKHIPTHYSTSLGGITNNNVSHQLLPSFGCQRIYRVYEFLLNTYTTSVSKQCVVYLPSKNKWHGCISVFRWDYRRVLKSDWDQRSAKKRSRFSFAQQLILHAQDKFIS